jgi:hypothetical protein
LAWSVMDVWRSLCLLHWKNKVWTWRKKMQLPECMNWFLSGLAVMQLHVIKYSSARACISILHVDDIVFSDMADLVPLGATWW